MSGDTMHMKFLMTAALESALLREDVPNKYNDCFYLPHPFGYQNIKVNFDVGRQEIDLETSLTKFLQGHNIGGSNRILYLALKVIRAIYKYLGVEFSKKERTKIKAKRIKLQRLDIACNFFLKSQAEVSAVLEALLQRFQAEGKPWTGYGKNGVESVYLQIHSKRVGIKFYNKGLELAAHPISDAIVGGDILKDYAERSLRFEVTFRAEELNRLGLNYADCWTPALVREVLEKRLAKLKLNGPVDPSTPVPSAAVKAPAAFYRSLWESGTDFRGNGGYPPFKRTREALLNQEGIDILIPKVRTPKVPLQELLSNSQIYFVGPKALTRKGLIVGAGRQR